MSRLGWLGAAFRAFATIQTLLLAALILAGGFALTTELALLPQAIAGITLALGLVSIYPTATHAWGAREAYGWLARTPLARDGIEPHRPLQFAASLLVLLASAAIRLPAWLASGIPSAVAQFHVSVASDGLAPTLWACLVITVVCGGLLALALAFSALIVWEALRPGDPPASSATAANTTVLWHVVATAVLASAELPGLFGERDQGPSDWRWWVALLLALALARRVLVLSLLFAYDRLEIPLDATLASRVLPVRIPPRATALCLLTALSIQLALDPWLGVAGSAAVIVVASGPLVWLVERSTPRTQPTHAAH